MSRKSESGMVTATVLLVLFLIWLFLLDGFEWFIEYLVTVVSPEPIEQLEEVPCANVGSAETFYVDSYGDLTPYDGEGDPWDLCYRVVR